MEYLEQIMSLRDTAPYAFAILFAGVAVLGIQRFLIWPQAERELTQYKAGFQDGLKASKALARSKPDPSMPEDA